MKKNNKKFIYIAVKAAMLILTAVYALIMVCTAGIGLIYNSDSYSLKITICGILFIISGISMTVGAILCLSRKKLPNVISSVVNIAGLVLSLTVLFTVCSHANSAGWVDNRTFKPVSNMYKSRILPVIIPSVTAFIISILQLKKHG